MNTIQSTSSTTQAGIAAFGRSKPLDASAAASRPRGDRVETLKHKIETGTYDVPAAAVADAIIASVRGTGRAAYEAFAATARSRIR